MKYLQAESKKCCKNCIYATDHDNEFFFCQKVNAKLFKLSNFWWDDEGGDIINCFVRRKEQKL